MELSGSKIRLIDLDVNKLNSNFLRDIKDALISIKFPVVDLFDSRICEHLKARPAGRCGDIDLRIFDANSVASGLNNGVSLSMDGTNTMAILHHMSHLIAVRHASN